MSFVPRHYKKRNPLDRQVLGTYRPPPANMPACRCSHTWGGHAPVGMNDRGECLHPRCKCQGYRDFGAKSGWLCVGCGKPTQLGRTCVCGTTATRSATRGDSDGTS